MAGLLRKVRWTDILNLGLSFAMTWFFYALLRPGTINYTLAFLSGLSFWAFMTWIYDLRRYGLERDLGWFGWTLSILGGFAAYGCLLGGAIFMLTGLPDIAPSRGAPFLKIALGCLIYTLIGLFTFLTRFKVGPNHIVIIGSDFYWPGDELRLYPFRNFEGSILNRFIPVNIRDLTLECSDGMYKVNVSTTIEVSTEGMRLWKASGAQRSFTPGYLAKEAEAWVTSSILERARCRTFGSTVTNLPPGGYRELGLRLSWTQRPTVQLAQ